MVSYPLAIRPDQAQNRSEYEQFSVNEGVGVDDGVRTRDFRSHSPALYR